MSAYQTFGPLFNLSGGNRDAVTAGQESSQTDTTAPPAQNFNGAQLRDEGIKQVSEHNENWMGLALELSNALVTLRKDDFTGEDLRIAITSSAIGNPQHPNAWGALISTLIKRKIIVPTGEYRAMKDSSSHARKTPVYKAT